MTDQEYKTMIQSIVIPDDLPAEEKQKRYQPLNEYLQSNMPALVYRFRRCSDRSISELCQYIISFTHGDKMNDDFDGMLYFDRDKILANIRSVLEKDDFAKIVHNIQKENFPPILQNKLPAWMLTILQQKAQQIPAEEIGFMLQELYDQFVDQLNISSAGLRSIIQKNIPFACLQQMILTKKQYGKEDKYIAWHGYQSFKPGEVTPEICHKIGIETAKEMWGDRFQIIVTTHLDKDHLHNHFCFNSVSFRDGKKYNYFCPRLSVSFPLPFGSYRFVQFRPRW